MVGKGMVHKDEEIEGTDKDIPDHDIPDQVTPDIIEGAIDERERQEAYMTKEEINLRDTINKELAKRKYHLRLAGLNLSNGAMYDYVQPMLWPNEFAEVTLLIERILVEASTRR